MFRFLNFLLRVIGAAQVAVLGALVGFLCSGLLVMMGLIAHSILGWMFSSWNWEPSFDTGMWILAIGAAIGGMIGAVVGYIGGIQGFDIGISCDEDVLKKWWQGQIRVASLAFILVFVLPWIFASFGGDDGIRFGSPPFEIDHLGKWVLFVLLCPMLHAFRKSASILFDAVPDEDESEHPHPGREHAIPWPAILAGIAFVLAIAFFMAGVQHEKMRARAITYSIFSDGPHCAYAVYEEDYWRCYGRSGFGIYHEYPTWDGEWDEPFYHLRDAYDSVPKELRECYDREWELGRRILGRVSLCEKHRPTYSGEPDPDPETETPAEIGESGTAQEGK